MRSFGRDRESQERPAGGLVGVKGHVLAIRTAVSTVTHEEQANEQDHSKERPDNVFHRDTFHQRNGPRPADAKPEEA